MSCLASNKASPGQRNPSVDGRGVSSVQVVPLAMCGTPRGMVLQSSTMTDVPQSPELLQDQLIRAVHELLPEVGESPMTSDILTRAGQVVAERQNKRHRLMHADAQRGGAVCWGMREQGMTWREIDRVTGIAPRTAQRWVRLFLNEGVVPRASGELDQRWQGRESEGDEA